MGYATAVRGERFAFEDLRTLLAKANEEKSGDRLAGIGARSERERVAAKSVLADLPLAVLVDEPLLDPAHDEVSRLIAETHDAAAFAALRSLTVGELRERLLGGEDVPPYAVVPEIAAAVAKLMTNLDLVSVARRMRRVTRCRNTLGEAGVLGIRVQPNHPADDLAGILLSTVDGLLFGCGDAVIGVNPASESVESVSAILRALGALVERWEIPTQACCLAHVSTQLAALERGAPIDLLFQSIAGTEAANASFGITLDLLREGRERVLAHHRARGGFLGEDVMYFETGQGSALSAEAHHGIDQLTCEARAYGVARAFSPHLVNSVVGFIGPEYLHDERQIVRAGLEDHFMGKLLGLPMGVDVCYTNHVAADQNSCDNLLVLLASAGCNYFMGVPCADDVMLGYQSTSFHDAAAVRALFGLVPAPEFAGWLDARGVFTNGRRNRGGIALRRDLLRTVERLALPGAV
ncbi:MAG: ethanolamine ammonia-lyase subunit EutB [Deltaproteobacteria bacterium]|nr:ethanolamine ammonia-lyase subunit EutB [Deltaproteobacteria bacterium]